MQAPDRTKTRAKRFRREMSLSEVILWKHLKGRALDGLHFRRQHPIGSYVLDFYCESARLCVEVDGSAYHVDEQAEFDIRRDEVLLTYGIRTLRLEANDVLKQLELALGAISEAASGP